MFRVILEETYRYLSHFVFSLFLSWYLQKKRDGSLDNKQEDFTFIISRSRRAHLKDCFDHLKAEVPCQRDRKITNLQVLNLAIKYIQVTLSRQ